jgi:hypothetical protein
MSAITRPAGYTATTRAALDRFAVVDLATGESVLFGRHLGPLQVNAAFRRDNTGRSFAVRELATSRDLYAYTPRTASVPADVVLVGSLRS